MTGAYRSRLVEAPAASYSASFRDEAARGRGRDLDRFARHVPDVIFRPGFRESPENRPVVNHVLGDGSFRGGWRKNWRAPGFAPQTTASTAQDETRSEISTKFARFPSREQVGTSLG
jgi:hypothetical protein